MIVNVLVRRREQFLLLRRTRDARWVLPSDLLPNADEPASSTACRVLANQAALITEPKKVWMAHAQHNRDAAGSRIDLFFLVRTFRGIPMVDRGRFDRLSWYGPDDLPDDLSKHLRVAIDLHRTHWPYAETGWTIHRPRLDQTATSPRAAERPPDEDDAATTRRRTPPDLFGRKAPTCHLPIASSTTGR
jgi:hypothetical protein